jgi:NAD(P)-dependent dehydrogenase (short-subunit alcohol dehydrogenase family)/pimeloyl-ACP methyl ester carboxylesterase
MGGARCRGCNAMTSATRTRTVTGFEGVQLHVVERGDADAPTVLLVHGYPDSHVVWDPVATRLAARYHVVAYDVRGAGASDRPWKTSAYKLEALIADLAAVVDAVSPDRPVHLVAHDWGSIQCWDAVTEPGVERFASYTSISGPSLDHVSLWVRTQSSRGLGGLRAMAGQGLKSWYVYAFQTPVLPPLVWRLVIARRFAKVLGRIEGVHADATWPGPTLASDGSRGMKLYRANMLGRARHPRVRRTDVPVQLIVPQRDPFVSPKLLDGFEQIAPTLLRRDVAGGHWIVRSHPERVARWISAHVDAVERGERPITGRREVVVVTGAGSGIGRETAIAFAERGATVVCADINAAAAERTAELCELVGGVASASVVDVGDLDAMTAFAKAVEDEHGAPDVVVNNAGIGMAGPFLDTSVEDWERLLHVNLWGVIHGSRLFGKQMVERGEGGHIVNTASAAAFTPSRTLSAYSTSKAAVLMLTECLRAELASEGIGVSAICPGFIDTGIAASTRYVGVSDDEQSRLRKDTDRLYKRRNFTPDKVAAAIIHAVDADIAVVPVAPEAQLSYAASRFTPGLMRRFARIDLTRGPGR